MKMFNLFKRPRSWIRGNEAQANPWSNEWVDPNDSNATCFCLEGGIQRCYPRKKQSGIRKKLESYIRNNYDRYIYIEEFNDGYSKLSRKKVVKLCKALNI